jgi:hypothetical protein
MEAIARIVADSLARHGLDRPVDPRRLQWSRWFRCESPHSLLVVPSKPGIFALAEEIMNLGPDNTHAPVTDREGHDFSRGTIASPRSPALSAAGSHTADVVRHMLAVLQFSEDDDMAFTLDRMFTCINPMRARLASGRCFLRFVVIEDGNQRRSICNALNQWMQASAEKASGLSADFTSSLELAPIAARVGRTLAFDSADTIPDPASPATDVMRPAPYLDSGADKNLHCPQPLPSGF